MTLAERMAALAAKIGPKRARMEAIQKTADEDGERQLNESEADEFDGLADEVKDLEVQLRRLKALDASAATARPALGDNPDAAARARQALPATVKPATEKGLAFARLVMSFAAAKGQKSEALNLALQRYPTEKQIHAILKAQIAGGTTTDPDWAAPLVDPTNLISEFVEFLRPQTIIGRFGTGNIPSLRRVPFNIRVPVQTTGGSADWVGEGKAKPLTRFAFSQIILRWTKVAAISVLSEDLVRHSSPSAELLVRQSLADAIVAKLDTDFANPSVSETTDVRPGAITNGAATSAASGIDADAVRADIRTAITYFITNNIPTAGLVILMRSSQALSLSLMRNALGNKEFPDMTMNGGLLEGIPVIASQYIPQGVVVFASADNIYLADDGGVAIDMSREASLEMANDPSNAIASETSPEASVEATMVSMFQTNSVAIRAERIITWKRRRSTAVYYLTGTGWGNADTSPPQAAI